MRILRFAAAALAVLSLMAVSSPALANPTGSTYTVTVDNFGGCVAGDPLCAGPSVLTWDGISEAIPNTSLSLNETATDDPIVLPPGVGCVTGFEPACGGAGYAGVAGAFGTTVGFGPNVGYELLEVWLSDTNPNFGAGIPDINAFSGITVADLLWPNMPNYYGQTLAGTGFVYFTSNGVVVPVVDAFGQTLPIGPHPFNPAIPSGVLYTGSPATDTTPVSITINSGAFNVPWSVLEAALGLSGLSVNDLHVGILVEHVLPEPASALLLGLGLAGVAALRRRKA